MKLERHPTLYTDWLSRIDRTISPPDVMIGDFPGFSGMYCPPGSMIWRDGAGVEERIPHPRGLILLSSAHKNDEAGVVAHEFRHHMQWNRGLLPEQSGRTSYAVDWSRVAFESYRAEILRYFTRNAHELDALRFEHRHAPRDHQAEEWLDWIGADALRID